ncbi:MAG TPA: response regulator transcription factor [Solirubrobacteraceae bacterium]|nr:response regulator transcription factor [Solirubrobacteraceae bacterium]
MPETAPTVLIVEDDPISRGFLRDNLVADGFQVLQAGTVAAARRHLAEAHVDLAVLDLGLPDEDGLALLGAVREGERILGRVDPDLPLLVLSGRGSEVDRLRGFRQGADDYLVKPFSYRELLARIRALLGRRGRRPCGSRTRIGPLELDTISRQVWLDGEPVKLSGKEYGLLVALAADPMRVYTREELLCGVWGFQQLCPTRTLDTHACRLRQKLSRGGARFVVNVWGVGYRLIDGLPT